MFEQNLANAAFSRNAEKTFIDKILSRQDVEELRELIKKPTLEREDLLEILYLISGVESKLWNLGDWDRYVILKYFVWIREFVKAAELLYDYQDKLDEQDLTERTKKLFASARAKLEHNAKFLIDLYLNIGRTSLSRGATGFLELLKNKFEMAYSGLANTPTQVQNDTNKIFKNR